VKFLVDANLPRRLSRWLISCGHDAIHVLDLPNGSETDDYEIIQIANSENRIVITKDADFVWPFETRRGPPGLILIAIGNCRNRELLELLELYGEGLFAATAVGVFVEVRRDTILIRP
jgi:predicted nuclease of predicted toxin-antitoxin system